MIKTRKSSDRGFFDHGWLKTHHTFSFADYHDPQFMGFGPIRVINEDWIAPGRGFGRHPHRDMEIVTYVIEGALEHGDNMGNSEVIRPNEVQRMSAGTGVIHSEFNHSTTDAVHLIQIWILPNERGLAPSYEQRSISSDEKVTLLASGDARDNSVFINQELDLYRVRLSPGEAQQLPLLGNGYFQVVRGVVTAFDSDNSLDGSSPQSAGDGVFLTEVNSLTLRAEEESELLLFSFVR